MTPYELGILWATCCKIGDKYLLRNKDPYFAQRIQQINDGKIWQSNHPRNNTVLYCLVIKRKLWEELKFAGHTGRKDADRIFPITEDNMEFARAYLQCHSVLDIWNRTIKGKQYSTPRLRIHGAKELMDVISEIVALAAGVKVKKTQRYSNSSMCILFYQSPAEVIKICDWLLSDEHSPLLSERISNLLSQYKFGLKDVT